MQIDEIALCYMIEIILKFFGQIIHSSDNLTLSCTFRKVKNDMRFGVTSNRLSLNDVSILLEKYILGLF